MGYFKSIEKWRNSIAIISQDTGEKCIITIGMWYQDILSTLQNYDASSFHDVI